jgi:hypothetical protein
LSHKRRHNLLRKVPEDGKKHEYGKHLVLQALKAVVCLVKGEADEKTLRKNQN